MTVELLAFRSQFRSPVGADKQCTAKLPLQIIHGAGNIGLVVHQNRSRSCEAFVFGNVVKDTVIIVCNIHKMLLDISK